MMRVLLQHKETQLYIKEVDAWTPDKHEAMDFRSSTEAIGFWEKHHTPNVQVVLTFQDERYDIVLDACNESGQAKRARTSDRR